MRHGSLFSGIGGFDLAAEWMGWENVFQVEKDKWCQKVLAKNFPQTKRYADIKEFDGTKYRGSVDILTGGFPCQPFSTAGRRKGTEDDRYLWPEMLRIIGEIQPRFIVGENVYGLINWSEGLVFEQVQTSLEDQGYQVAPVILPACAIGAPHRRDRIWFIAHATNTRIKSLRSGGENSVHEFGTTPNASGNRRERIGSEVKDENRQSRSGEVRELERGPEGLCFSESTTNTNTKGLQRGEINGGIRSIRQNANEQPTGRIQSAWQEFPTQSPVCGGNDGIPNRMDRIKGLGNAIVPQVAYQIFKAIDKL